MKSCASTRSRSRSHHSRTGTARSSRSRRISTRRASLAATPASPSAVERHAVDGLGEPRQQVPLADVGRHRLRRAQQRVAQPRRALHHRQVQVALGERLQGGEVVLLEGPLALDLEQGRVVPVAVADRVGLALARPLQEVGALDVVDVGRRAGVAAEQPLGAEHPRRAEVLELPEGRLPDHQQRLEAGAAAVAARPAAGGLEPARQVDHRADQLPHLDVAGVALGVEHRRAGVGAVEHVLPPHALRRDLEVHDRRRVAVLVDAAALDHVPGAGVGADHLLDEAARLERPRERAREAGEGRLQERPGDPGRALGVAQVGDRALGEVGLDRQVGAVVDLVVADQGLRELHPDRPLHPRRRAVHRVPAPRRGALHVELVGAVAADPNLERRVHEEVAARPRGQPLLVGEGDVEGGHGAVATRHGHLADPRLERAPSLLDHLARELLQAVDALLEDHPLDRLADHVAAGQPGALVEQVVHRRPGPLLAAQQVPLGELVVLADLHAGQVDAVVEPVGRAHRHPSGRRGADVEHVGDAPRPGDQLALPEDRHEGLHVGVVDVADHRIVVGEDVARAGSSGCPPSRFGP